jgi:oxaloacetate decarboxylase (Na+ extruding) subunit alpha
VGEVTIEDAGLRVTVRRTSEQGEALAAPSPTTPAEEETTAAAPARAPSAADVIRIEAPMVGTFYRASGPGVPPFVEEGDVVGYGQILCILEAMKLMNEVKAEQEGIVRRICADNAQPVEYGQLLFELEPVNGRPAGL